MKLHFPKVAKYFFLMAAVLFTFSAAHAQDLRSVTIAKKIVLGIPQDFILMNDDAIAATYITTRRPVALYTNPAGNVDIGINKGVTQWRQGDMPILKDFYKANIMALYDEVTFLKEGIVSINGRDFAVFEFESMVREDENSFSQRPNIRKYTYIQYTIDKGMSWVFNLTAPANQRDQWRERAANIMGTVIVKK